MSISMTRSALLIGLLAVAACSSGSDSTVEGAGQNVYSLPDEIGPDDVKAGTFTVCKSAPEADSQLFTFNTTFELGNTSKPPTTYVPMVDLGDGECEDVFVTAEGGGPDEVTIEEIVPDGWESPPGLEVYTRDADGNVFPDPHDPSTTITGITDDRKDGCLVIFHNTPGPFCGDGNIDPGETCDPPGEPAGEPNECRDDCTFCGDGHLDEGEQCDDGNNMAGDGCDPYCNLEPFCGDGNIDPGETCDPPGEPAGQPNECRDDCTFCGDGHLDEGEQCDDGNNMAGDGCDPFCKVERGDQGCTPGYYKQSHHFCEWVYDPDDLFDDVFMVDAPGNDTLLEALSDGGGGETAFQRHAVAALLNAANGGVFFKYSSDEVKAVVQEAYMTGAFEELKYLLERANTAGCPLNNCRGKANGRR